MDSRKRTRIARDRLLVADYEVWAIDGTPASYLTYKLPKRFKVWWQFEDLIRQGYWSVELLIAIEKGNAKLLEVTPRGLTYERGLLVDFNSLTYIYKSPTEAVAGWHLGLVKSNLTLITAHSIELCLSRYRYKGGKSWILGRKDLTDEEYREIRTEVATKKRESFTLEKAQEVKKILSVERRSAKNEKRRFRGNQAIAEAFGVSVKTAEKWSAKVSTRTSGKQNTKTKGMRGNV